MGRRLILLTLLVAGCSGAAPTPQIVYVTPPPTAAPTASPSGHALTGTFTLNSADWQYVDPNDPSRGCQGINGYSDFGVGMPVTVRDGTGATIASSVTIFDHASVAAGCIVKFTVADVPDTATYLVSVGKRGSIQYSRADLIAAQWFVQFTLGPSG